MSQTILIVEDDVLLGQTISDALTEQGYEVLWAKLKEQALEYLKSNTIDLVYLDIMLPGDDGYMILELLKNTQAYASIPVVMLSNLSQPGEVEKAKELGAEDFIVKSGIDLERLVEVTKEKLGS